MKKIALALIQLSLCFGSHASLPWLVDDFSAVYDAKVGIAKGTTKLQLRRIEDDQFVVESWTELKGLLSLFKPGEIHEYCEFSFVDGQVRPRLFTRRDAVSSEDRNVDVKYDWSANVATIDYQDRRETVGIEPGVSNTLLMQVVLMQSLSSDQQPPWFDVVGHKGRLRFEMDYAGEDQLTIDEQTVPLYRYSHSRVSSGIRTTFWAAPDRAHLPLRAEIKKGRKVKGELNLVDAAVTPKHSSD